MRTETATAPLLDVRGLRVSFPARGARGWSRSTRIHAVDGVDLRLDAGRTLGVVGESGCGKSTLARSLVGLGPVSDGVVTFAGERIDQATPDRRRRLALDLQMVYQDPYSSLNPRKRVGYLVSEAWRIHPGIVPRPDWAARVDELLSLVGLPPDVAGRFPHQLSGGQRQRVGIARAIAVNPRLIVCDEPVSALDVSVQAQILNVFADLRERLDLAYVFIAHDLAVVRHISDDIAVMYLGRIVESGPARTVYEQPAHPYTAALLSAAPDPMPWRNPRGERIVLRGEVPSPANPPSGCRFRTRCPLARPVCGELEPPQRQVAGRTVACHFAEESLGARAAVPGSGT
ncbi:ABC transporter ATP-binding protein [Jiangella gansuensis]|uniref:ABC transporter ATP-binding protein n=1 Tax=Jiangella gansuensis TaxID=281473 RepID=UPI000479769B|nr:oligopeptide/dipeptide ABC transporter ATP-binding protein [Jiangella gansuensis]